MIKALRQDLEVRVFTIKIELDLTMNHYPLAGHGRACVVHM